MVTNTTLAVEPARLQLPDGGDAAQSRHGDIEHQQIGLQPRCIGDHGEPVRHRRHDIVIAGEQPHQILEHRPMIIGDEHAHAIHGVVSIRQWRASIRGHSGIASEVRLLPTVTVAENHAPRGNFRTKCEGWPRAARVLRLGVGG